MRVVLLVLLACSHPAPADRAPVGSAAPADARAIGPAIAIAGDPPEPTAPVVECSFDRRVHCIPALARPFQRSPFEGCPATQPPTVKDPAFPDAQSHFSAAETRAAWTKLPGVCCYVDFVSSACD